jgi:hypothetical protein
MRKIPQRNSEKNAKKVRGTAKANVSAGKRCKGITILQ